VTNANINHAKLRCMQLLWKLAGNLKSVDFPQSQRASAEQALEEFKTMQDTVFALETDKEFEPHRENITAALDDLEQGIELATEFIRVKKKARKATEGC
jgi:hypothetical protein